MHRLARRRRFQPHRTPAQLAGRSPHPMSSPTPSPTTSASLIPSWQTAGPIPVTTRAPAWKRPRRSRPGTHTLLLAIMSIVRGGLCPLASAASSRTPVLSARHYGRHEQHQALCATTSGRPFQTFPVTWHDGDCTGCMIRAPFAQQVVCTDGDGVPGMSPALFVTGEAPLLRADKQW